MIRNKYVDEYIQQWRDGKIVFNQERIDLIEYLEKTYSLSQLFILKKRK